MAFRRARYAGSRKPGWSGSRSTIARCVSRSSVLIVVCSLFLDRRKKTGRSPVEESGRSFGTCRCRLDARHASTAHTRIAPPRGERSEVVGVITAKVVSHLAFTVAATIADRQRV